MQVLVQNTVRNRAVAQNWPQLTLRHCRFAFNCPVQNTARNCPVAQNVRPNTLRNRRFSSNWPVLLACQNLGNAPCTTFLLLEIGPK